MNDPEGFLSRWARRKRAVTEAAAAPADARDSDRPRESGDPEGRLPDSHLARRTASVRSPVRENERNVDSELPEDRSPHGDEKADKTEAEFDLSKLPSIDSITAETDIRPFLARGVPADLRQAALRRAWVADSHIRDFIGIAENQGDFTGAGDMPGFDFSPPTDDVARMVAEIFGGKQKTESRSRDKASGELPERIPEIDRLADATEVHRNVTPPSEIAETDDRDSAELSSGVPTDDRAVRQTIIAANADKNVASQNNDATPEEKIPVARRTHGGAMPK